jgi:hypothetical protein
MMMMMMIIQSSSLILSANSTPAGANYRVSTIRKIKPEGNNTDV